jgi:winged helix DNA-binding protein
MELSEDGVRRARARAQLLSGVRRPGVEAVVATVVGVQAQDLTAAGLAIRARRRRTILGDVGETIDSRSLVLTWSLRGTRHLHHAGDVRWLLQLCGRAFAAGSPARNRQLGLAGAAGDGAVRAVRDALHAHGPLTRAEIKRRLARRGIDPSGQAPIHVLRRAALEGVCCVVPGRDGDERYVLLDDWVPAARPVDTEIAAAELARRYLLAFGPATPADFATWCGLPRRLTNAAWTAISDRLIGVTQAGTTLWAFSGHRRTIASAAGRPAPLRLLGAFDSLLLGYADRSPIVPPQHAKKVNAGGGLIRPTMLADGRVVGTWAYRRQRNADRIEVDPVRRLGPEDVAAVGREVLDVGRFLGGRPTLSFT